MLAARLDVAKPSPSPLLSDLECAAFDPRTLRIGR